MTVMIVIVLFVFNVYKIQHDLGDIVVSCMETINKN